MGSSSIICFNRYNCMITTGCRYLFSKVLSSAGILFPSGTLLGHDGFGSSAKLCSIVCRKCHWVEYDKGNDSRFSARVAIEVLEKQVGKDSYWVCPRECFFYEYFFVMFGCVYGFRVEKDGFRGADKKIDKMLDSMMERRKDRLEILKLCNDCLIPLPYKCIFTDDGKVKLFWCFAEGMDKTIIDENKPFWSLLERKDGPETYPNENLIYYRLEIDSVEKFRNLCTIVH